jgi:hypothetical protein
MKTKMYEINEWYNYISKVFSSLNLRTENCRIIQWNNIEFAVNYLYSFRSNGTKQIFIIN